MENEGSQLPSLCMVATVPYALNVFLMPHIKVLSQTYRITLVSDGGEDEVAELPLDNVRFVSIKIRRKISLFWDLAALYGLWKLFRREKFNAVHSIAPKSGLLAMMAAKFAGVPLRIHTFTGQVWATQRGLSRAFMKFLDRLLAACATNLLADSFSQRDYLLNEQVVGWEKIAVLGGGSVCGVDTTRFVPHPVRRKNIRAKFEIPDNATVALYLGRLNRDKGILELGAAFVRAAEQCVDLYLLVVGPDEEGMANLLRSIAGNSLTHLRIGDFSAEPEACMAAADFFVLPSHREGFGSTVIEAAACGIPSIGSRIYGLKDAIVHGQTGLFVPVGDVDALAEAMVEFVQDPGFRCQLGRQAMERAINTFRTELLTDALSRYYERLWGALCH